MEFTFENLNKYKNDCFVIWRPTQEEEKIFTYDDIIKISETLLQKLRENCIAKNTRISIQFDTCPEIIVCILSILNLAGTFCPISHTINFKETLESMLHYQVKYILTSYCFDTKNNQQLVLLAKINILNSPCYLYERQVTNLYEKSPKICYSIKTSGTTGKPKVIQVPLKCIMPNVVALSKMFQVTKNDVIFAASPPTFDPFVLDLFLVLYNGASILLTPNTERLKINELCVVLFPQQSDKKGATIIQFTPSVFRLFNKELLRKYFFGDISSLRILVLGGEQFPEITDIRNWFDSEIPKTKRIFNIYGITEVSCWSTIEELKTLQNEEVSLGFPMDNETILEVRNIENSKIIETGIGELLIGSSSRKCIVNDETLEIIQSNEIVYRATGDLVSVSKFPDVKYYYKGRINDIIKRYGNRVNLKKIEEVFKSHNHIVNAACIFDIKNNLLLLFLIKTENIEFSGLEKIISNLSSEEKPDKIIYIDEFPISCHGKISKTKLLKLHEEKSTKSSQNLVKMLKESFINIFGESLPGNSFEKSKISKNYEHIWKSSFSSLGGTSFQAISIVAEIENFLKTPCPNIMEMLLNENTNVCDILEYCHKLSMVENVHSEPMCQSHDSIELKILWKHNSLKCIDSSPTILPIQLNQNLICVGSHSHLVICLDDTGNLRNQFKLPDRIESQIVFEKDDIGYVGCYDGFLYKFNPNTAQIIWKFNSMGMIKCKPLVMHNIIIFGNYSDKENLFCLNIQENKLIWSLRLGTKGILSSPIQLSKSCILVCTLDGTCSKINSINGTIVWCKKFDTPIFSTSVILLEENYIIVAEVRGNLHILNFDGLEITNYKADGTVFSSFEVIDNYDKSKLILFGSFDWNLYCLKFHISSCSISLLWKCKLQSQIYSTPKVFQLNNQLCVISCSSIGFVNIVNLHTGVLLKYLQLNGEIFSTPAIINNKIFLGCRDNNLYAIEITNNSNK